MKTQRLLPFAVIVLAGLSLGSGCPTFPKIEDRIVELAVGGSTSKQFQSRGEVGIHDKTGAYSLDSLDIAGILDKAGIDVADVKDLKFAGAEYRVVTPDTVPNRMITNGNVTIRRLPAVSEVSLISNFSLDVNHTVGWQKATLDAPGVAVVNQLLADILTAMHNRTPIPNPVLSVHVRGDAPPLGKATNFAYEIKLDITILGTVKISVLN